ncbi:EAL domain-containing protein [Acinetobacter baumannii]
MSLGRSLKLSVVAEGVETEAQAQQLRALGCREVQGFLVSQAVPADLVAQRFLCVTV